MVSSYKLSELGGFLQDIDQIMSEAWMILSKSPCVLDPGAVLFDQEVIAASLSFENDVRWVCSVIMPSELARYLAVQFYNDDDEDLDEEAVEETVGEFINIIAGNIQGLLNGSAYLSSPSTTVYPSSKQIPIQGIVRNYSTPTGKFIITMNIESLG